MVGEAAADEQARRSVVASRVVVHEHELGVRLDVVIELQVPESSGRVALVDTLKMVGGRVVVSLVAIDQRAGRRDLLGSTGGAKDSRWRRVARAAAAVRSERAVAREVMPIVQHTGCMIAMIGRDG